MNDTSINGFEMACILDVNPSTLYGLRKSYGIERNFKYSLYIRTNKGAIAQARSTIPFIIDYLSAVSVVDYLSARGLLILKRDKCGGTVMVKALRPSSCKGVENPQDQPTVAGKLFK